MTDDRYDRIVNLLGDLVIVGFGLAWTCLALAVVIQVVG